LRYGMKSEFLANVVWVLHVLFVLWLLITPFTNNGPMLVLTAILIPFLWVHWSLGLCNMGGPGRQDICALTLAERYLRGVDSSESFFHNLVSPVYMISETSMSRICWGVTIVLWLITVRKIMKNPGMVSDAFFPKPPHPSKPAT
jgi:hypothetical protein